MARFSSIVLTFLLAVVALAPHDRQLQHLIPKYTFDKIAGFAGLQHVRTASTLQHGGAAASGTLEGAYISPRSGTARTTYKAQFQNGEPTHVEHTVHLGKQTPWHYNDKEEAVFNKGTKNRKIDRKGRTSTSTRPMQ